MLGAYGQVYSLIISKLFDYFFYHLEGIEVRFLNENYKFIF